MRGVCTLMCLALCWHAADGWAARKKSPPKAVEAQAADAKVLNHLTLACSTDNADVFVDGEMIGKAPIDLPVPVANGQHTIKVTKLGYAPYIDVFTAQPGQPVRLEVELVPISAVLHVTSPLKEVRVLVDGRYVGDAPVDVEMDAGPRAIQVSKICHQEIFKNVMAVAGEEISLVAELSELPAGSNPCVAKAPVPPRWYQKKWVWAVIAVATVAAAGATVGAVVGTANRDPLSGADVRYDVKFPTAP